MVKLELLKGARATELSLDQLNKGWQHNPATLEAFFEVCVRNWKEWGGARPSSIVPQINGTYIQATQGDYVDESHKSVEHAQRDETPSYMEWKRLKGVEQDTAKRRFITLLRSIDPRLLHVKAQPMGYVLQTSEGRPICPWANSGRGCPMPLLDTDGTPLLKVIDRDMEVLKSESGFRRWIASHEQHACWVGIHVPLLPLDVRPYLPWFQQKIVGGFKPYDSVAFRQLIKVVVDKQAAHFQHLMDTSKQHKFSHVEKELDALVVMIRVYRAYTQEDYSYEVLCTRNDHHCNQRRATDRGWNHKHPIVLSLMGGTFSMEAYERVAELREECRKVGLSVQTGVMRDVEQRYRILRDRLTAFYKQKAAAAAIRERVEKMVHRKLVRTLIPAAASERTNENLRVAITAGELATLPRAIHLGADRNGENSAGTTALIRAVMQADVVLVKKLVTELKCDVNYMNRRGMSALSWACKIGEPVMVETLLDLGADAAADGGSYTPFMVAVRCHRSDICDMILEYLFKDVRAGSRGVDRALNTQIKSNGSTALIIAAKHRMFGMVRHLLRRNANRYLRDLSGLSAESHARRAGWRAIADFLATTKAVGPTGIYGASDETSERDIKAASSRLIEGLKEHGAGTRPAATDTTDPSIMPSRLTITVGGVNGGSTTGGGNNSINASPASTTELVEAGTKTLTTPKGFTATGKALTMTTDEKVATTKPKSVTIVNHDQTLTTTSQDKSLTTTRPTTPIATVTIMSSSSITDSKAATIRPGSATNSNTTTIQPGSVTSSTTTTTPGSAATTTTTMELAKAVVAARALSSTVVEPDLPFPIALMRSGNVAPDLETNDGSTSLICAAFAGDVKLAHALMKEGASVNYENRHGRTALMAAAAGGSKDMCIALIYAGAYVLQQDTEGRTATRYASEAGHAELATFLGLVTAMGVQEAVKHTDDRMHRQAAKEDEQEVKRRKLYEEYGLSSQERAEADLTSWTWRITKPNVPMRCWKCTRYVPCSHFPDKESLKASVPFPEKQWQWHYQPRGWRRERRFALTMRVQEERKRKEREEAAAAALRPKWLSNTPPSPKQMGASISGGDDAKGRPASPSPFRPGTGQGSSRPNTSSSSHSSTQRTSMRGSTPGSSGSAAEGLGGTGGSVGQTVHFIDNKTGRGRPQPDDLLSSTSRPVTGGSAGRPASSGSANERGFNGDTASASRQDSAEQATPGQQQQQLATIVEDAKVVEDTTSRPALFQGRVPLRIRYWNVRSHLAPKQKRDYSKTKPAKFLMRLGKTDALIARTLRHANTKRDWVNVYSEDNKIFSLRSATIFPPPPQQAGDSSHSKIVPAVCGFVTVAVRYGMCVYHRCSRCGIGFAKLRSRGLHSRPLCDLCILLRVMGARSIDLDSPDNPDTVDPAASSFSRVLPMSIPGALAASLDSLPDDVEAGHLMAAAEGQDKPTPTTPPSTTVASTPRRPSSSQQSTPRRLSSTASQAGRRRSSSTPSAAAVPLSPSDSRPTTPSGLEENKEGKKKVSRFMQSLQKEMLDELPLERRVSLSFVSDKDLARVGRHRGAQRLYQDEPGVYYLSKNLDLADFFVARGKTEEAEGLLLKTLQDHLDIYGTTHVSIALIMRSLGQVEELRGLLPLARAYRETSFELLSTMFGPLHRETFRAANLLARSLVLQDHYADAIFFYREMARQLRTTHSHTFYDQADLYEEAADKLDVVRKEHYPDQWVPNRQQPPTRLEEEEAMAAAKAVASPKGDSSDDEDNNQERKNH